MISDADIEDKARQLDVSPQDVERDYVHGWLLKEIYNAPLGNRLVLKGGNGIRKGYINGARYSKDLDFSCVTELGEQELHDQLQNILVAAGTESGVEFSLDRTRIGEKRINIAGVKATEARVYFKGFYAQESITLRSHLDITELEQSYLPIQSRSLIHPYSDSSKCFAQIRCQKLEEILASKLTTLLFRRKAQDLFDLIFAIFFNPELQISRREVIGTFLKKSIFDPEARQAREQLLAVPIQLFSPLWMSLAIPNTSRLSFEVVPSRFNQLVQELFGLLSPQAPPSPRGLYGRAAGARLLSTNRAFVPVSRSFLLGTFFGPHEETS
jgi:predicted nucleotidyltransferase component of viral defense system